MTTLCTDGKVMVCDGMVNDEGMITDMAFNKIRRLKDGSIVGGTGSAFDLDRFVGWLASGEQGDVPCALWEKGEFLMLRADGKVFCCIYQGRPIETPSRQALGSGAGFAMAAMMAGADPMEAVKISCTLDIYSGGEIFAEAI